MGGLVFAMKTGSSRIGREGVYASVNFVLLGNQKFRINPSIALVREILIGGRRTQAFYCVEVKVPVICSVMAVDP